MAPARSSSISLLFASPKLNKSSPLLGSTQFIHLSCQRSFPKCYVASGNGSTLDAGSPLTAAIVSSSLLLGICSLPDTKFKALVNVGVDLAKLVPGRVSTEIDVRLGYDARGIIHKVHGLLKLYDEHDVSTQRLLFKIPSTWVLRLLESEGIQTHLTLVYSFSQAAAQAGASVIHIFIGCIRDQARQHSGDPEIEAALKEEKILA